jgi:hypothetical protein
MKLGLISASLGLSHAAEYVKGKTGNDSHMSYDIWAPEKEGSFPVMVFVTGLGGSVPGATYSQLGKTMADSGMVVAMLSRAAPPQPKTNAGLEALAVDWLEEAVPSMGLKATADFDKLILSGHSAGNHVTCDFLVDSCGNHKAKGVVMMDPVDGYDPFGMIDNYCTTVGEKLNFDIPALLLRTGLDPVKKLGVACAPDRISNQRFFDAWSGPIWLANATKYGHLDVNDADVTSIGGLVCAAQKTEDDGIYHDHIAELVQRFMATIFDGDSDAEAKLNDASSMAVAVELLKDYNGHNAPFKAGCTLKSEVSV